MEQPNEETPAAEYPRGRGYGHDYMRGGEVFGGYGYSEREEYELPRGELASGTPQPAGDEADQKDADGSTAEPGAEARSDVPTGDGGAVPPRVDAGGAPVPHLEHVFGATSSRRHSRSYYVTQAQLQQRLYGPRRAPEDPDGTRSSG